MVKISPAKWKLNMCEFTNAAVMITLLVSSNCYIFL